MRAAGEIFEKWIFCDGPETMILCYFPVFFLTLAIQVLNFRIIAVQISDFFP